MTPMYPDTGSEIVDPQYVRVKATQRSGPRDERLDHLIHRVARESFQGPART